MNDFGWSGRQRRAPERVVDLEATVEIPVPLAKGVLIFRGPRHKLDLDQRMAIRRRVKSWEGLKKHIYAKLAREYGVSTATIIRTVLG